MVRTIPVERARRLALAAQGFHRPRPGSIDVRHFRRALGDVGLVQLDSVNVIARAHYLPFFARLGPYDTGVLDRWLWRSGELFEYWGHEASVLPIDDWPLMGHRMRNARPWQSIARIVEEHPEFVDRIHDEVHERGPLTVGDLAEGGERTGPWWGWGRGKLALEWLFVTGRLTVADRPNFTKVYDTSARVIPAHLLEGEKVDTAPARRRLLRRAVRHHGIGSVADLADYYRIRPTDARPLLEDLARAGEIVEVDVPGWKGPAYLDPEISIPRSIEARALLAPFDPVVWFRDRALRLFDFHYRIEIYVPEPKRVYGYYVLPFLLEDRLVGRVDLKADRSSGRLLVRGCYGEERVDRLHVGRELAAELGVMAAWMGLGEVEVTDRGDLAHAVAVALG
jgi:uncharacterized protein YcaQ